MTQFPETHSTLLVDIRSPENSEAWEEFVVIYRPVIYRMARRRGMQDADAQDVTQAVLVRIANSIGRYDQSTGPRFRHWLRRVARNAIFSAITRAPQDVAAGGSVALDLLNEQVDTSLETRQELEAEFEREQYLRAAALVRADVNAETWKAFELTVLQGTSCERAAELIGKSVGTIYAGRSRIMRRLREKIAGLQKEKS